MAISYTPLLVQLTRRRIQKIQLERDGICSRNTIAKFNKGEYVSMEVIDKLCTYLDCKVEDVIEHVKEKHPNQ